MVKRKLADFLAETGPQMPTDPVEVEAWFERLRQIGKEENQYEVKNENPLELSHFRLLFEECGEKLLGRSKRFMEGCGDYIREVNAKIVGWESGYEDDIEMGHIKAQVIQLQRVENDGIDLWELCDDYSRDISYVYTDLLSPEARARHKAEQRLQEELDGDLLYIDEVRLEPKYRGYGLGLLAVHGLIESIPSFTKDAVVICPAALPADERNANGEDLGHYADEGAPFDITRRTRRREASKKLENYWRMIGFRTWADASDTQFPLLGLWTDDSHLPIEEVVPHLCDKT